MNEIKSSLYRFVFRKKKDSSTKVEEPKEEEKPKEQPEDEKSEE